MNCTIFLKHNFIGIQRKYKIPKNEFRLDIFNMLYQVITFMMYFHPDKQLFIGNSMGVEIELNVALEGIIKYNNIIYNISWETNEYLSLKSSEVINTNFNNDELINDELINDEELINKYKIETETCNFTEFKNFDRNSIFNRNITIPINYYIDYNLENKFNYYTNNIKLQQRLYNQIKIVNNILKKINFKVVIDNIYYTNVAYNLSNSDIINRFVIHKQINRINIMYTTLDINTSKNKNILGSANIGRVCSNNANIILNHNELYIEGITLAHEIGHIFGFDHKEQNEMFTGRYHHFNYYKTNCFCLINNCLMSESFRLSNTEWSNCNYIYLLTHYYKFKCFFTLKNYKLK